MKILITTDTFSPVVNGVVTSVLNLYRELKNAGHDVRILTLSNTGRESISGDVYYVRSLRIGVYPDARIKQPFFNRLLKRIIEWGPDILHSQTEFSMMLASRTIANKLCIPHIHTYHTMYENYLDYVLGGRIITPTVAAFITKSMFNRLDGIITASLKTKRALLRYGVNTPLHIIPTGIAVDSFQLPFDEEDRANLLAQLNISTNNRILAFVGRIAEEKNIVELLELLPDVIQSHSNVKLLIVGGGPYLDELKKQITTRELERYVMLTGMVAPEEVYKYYHLADVFVNASTSETQGLTYIEALSSGCPVVCKYDPCIDGVVEQGFNGFTYTSRNQFAPYIDELLRNNEMRRQMSCHASSTARKYSGSVFANQIEDLYNNLLRVNKISRAPFERIIRYITKKR
ncbi:glycosyltransferase family 4 protein [Paenibacillus sp. OV219]|uniref:glycosyltransferase family 4 protein n=1 Tax=Paenibacillus sp. OV219 TaxID=1884377 RepID=UPI0008CB6EF4|nr:glycosyltransferase family 4 protein [Paenibacillus sp. OV219]SEM54004.1 1,2-diacylglycerol 3-glucosyltransferase [Paenibacillus sp. OV219]